MQSKLNLECDLAKPLPPIKQDKLTRSKRMFLDIGWCTGYMALQYHMEDACKESGVNLPVSPSPPYALFPHSYVSALRFLEKKKKIDYCFIGSIDSAPRHRAWVLDFARKHFTENSVFINTDIRSLEDNYVPLGAFDRTNDFEAFSRNKPKSYVNDQSREAQLRSPNEQYFKVLSESRFVLCPRGDASWSFRFYETILCGAIPIVHSWHDTYRAKEESCLTYKYLLAGKFPHVFDEGVVLHNYKIIDNYHVF